MITRWRKFHKSTFHLCIDVPNYPQVRIAGNPDQGLDYTLRKHEAKLDREIAALRLRLFVIRAAICARDAEAVRRIRSSDMPHKDA